MCTKDKVCHERMKAVRR